MSGRIWPSMCTDTEGIHIGTTYIIWLAFDLVIKAINFTGKLLQIDEDVFLPLPGTDYYIRIIEYDENAGPIVFSNPIELKRFVGYRWNIFGVKSDTNYFRKKNFMTITAAIASAHDHYFATSALFRDDAEDDEEPDYQTPVIYGTVSDTLEIATIVALLAGFIYGLKQIGFDEVAEKLKSMYTKYKQKSFRGTTIGNQRDMMEKLDQIVDGEIDLSEVNSALRSINSRLGINIVL